MSALPLITDMDQDTPDVPLSARSGHRIHSITSSAMASSFGKIWHIASIETSVFNNCAGGASRARRPPS